MKTSLSIPLLRLVVASLIAGSCQSAAAEQPAAPVYPQYASTYYPPQKLSMADRLRNAGQNVGDFVRRKFYGDGGAARYQQPVYQTPGGYRTQKYNLDAPAGALEVDPRQDAGRSVGTTGFQEPARSTVPKYQTPPKEEAVPSSKPGPRSSETLPPTSKKAETKQAGTKTKTSSSPAAQHSRSREGGSAERTSPSRYTPAKPSTFAKTSSKTSPAKKHVEDAPPAPISRLKKDSAPSTIVHQDSPPASPKEPQMEAKLGTEGSPPSTNESEVSPGGGIAPTIGGTDFDLTPKSPLSSATEEKNKAAESGKSSEKPGNEGEAKSGSFMVGKKGSKPGRVVSPYPPYNELDITGLPAGSLALDPTTQKVFQVP